MEPGEFRVKTGIDDAGITQGTDRILKSLDRLVKATEKIASANAKAFTGSEKNYKTLVDAQGKAIEKTKSLIVEEKKFKDELVGGSDYEETLEEQYARLEAVADATIKRAEAAKESSKAVKELSDAEKTASDALGATVETNEQYVERLTSSAKKLEKTVAEALTAESGAKPELINEVAAETQELIKEAKELAAVQDEAFGAKHQKQLERGIEKLEKKNLEYDKQAAKVQAIKDKIEALGGAGDTSEEYIRLQKVLGDVEQKFNSLTKAKEYLYKTGDIEGAEKLESQLYALHKAAEELKAKMKEIELKPEDTSEYRQLENDLALANQQLDLFETQAKNANSELERIVDTAKDILNPVEQLPESFEKTDRSLLAVTGRLKEVMSILLKTVAIPSAIARGISRVAGGVKGLIPHFNKTNKSAGGLLGTVDKLGKRLLQLGAAIFVFNLIRKALRSMQAYFWDVIRTNDQFVNSLASIKGNLLTAFQPIYEAVLPALNALAAALARVTAYIATFVSLLFGKSVTASQKAAKGLYDQAKAYGAVGSAAKDAANQLAAFDEINVLAQDNAGGGGGGGSSDVIVPDFEYDFSFLDEFSDKLEQFLDVFKEAWANVGEYVIDNWNHALTSTLDLAKKIGDTFFEIWTDGHGQIFLESFLTLSGTILGIIGDIAAAFSAAWDTYGYDVIGSFFEMLTSILNLLNSIGAAFREAWNNSVGLSIAENLMQIYTNINLTISELANRFREAWEASGNGVAIWEVFLGIINDILNVVREMTEATLEWVKNLNLEPLISGFRGLLEAIRPVVTMIVEGLGSAYENVLLPFGKWLLELAVPAALDALTKAFEAIGAIIEVIKPAATWIWEEFLKPLGEWTGGKIIEALDFIGEKFQQVTDWIKENGEDINTVLVGIGTVFKTVWDDYLKPTLDTLWEGFKGVIDGVLDMLGGLITFLAGVFTGDWEKAWEGVHQIFKGMWNSNASILETIVNGIINGLNFFIKQINRLQWDVPDWVPIIGGNQWGFNLPELGKISIPKLATGAVIPPNSEFIAMLGDQKSGRNIEAPEGLIDEIVGRRIDEAMDRLADIMEASSGSGQPVNIQIDGETILTAVINAQSRRGKNLVSGNNLVLG